MITLLFTLNILATAGTLLFPIFIGTRGLAIGAWATSFIVCGATSFAIDEYYPTWEVPAWRLGPVWAIAAWVFFIAGLVIAVRKPRRREVPMQ